MLLYYILATLFFSEVLSTKLGLLRKESKPPKPSPYGTRPRGVSFTRGPLFATGETFTCLDGSKKIPFAHVNDDYCDCADGSDEPGSSACRNAFFHCMNRGFKPVDIPSSRVNDQICDCCDGSDEWDGAVDCPDVCNEVGKKWREEIQRKVVVAQKGFVKRAGLAAEGGKLKAEKEKGIDGLRKERDEILPLKEGAEAKKKEAEDKESEAKEKHRKAWDEVRKGKKKEKAVVLFKRFDVNGDGKITLDEVKKFNEFDTDNNGEVTDEEAKGHMFLDENDLEYFTDKVYDVIRVMFRLRSDKIAKENIKTKPGEKLERIEPELHKEEGEPETHAEELQPEARAGASESEEHTDESAEAEDSEEVTGVEEGKDEKEDDLHLYDDKDDEMPPYDEETKKLMDEASEARKAYNEIIQRLDNVESSIRESEAFLNGDYGTDAAWASLKGKCVELEENQYVYKLCLFDKASQREKSAPVGLETNIGHWGHWTGGEADKYSQQKYDGGQQCWNGPQRSTVVIIECGEETELVEAGEPAKCEYRFVLRSPAACPDPASLTELHDEL